jgi:hypothetical protein
MFLSRVFSKRRAKAIYDDVVSNSEHDMALFHDVFNAMMIPPVVKDE